MKKSGWRISRTCLDRPREYAIALRNYRAKAYIGVLMLAFRFLNIDGVLDRKILKNLREPGTGKETLGQITQQAGCIEGMSLIVKVDGHVILNEQADMIRMADNAGWLVRWQVQQDGKRPETRYQESAGSFEQGTRTLRETNMDVRGDCAKLMRAMRNRGLPSGAELQLRIPQHARSLDYLDDKQARIAARRRGDSYDWMSPG